MAIDIPSNFNLGARLPLDARYIVNTYNELTGGLIKYSGMQGYVVENKKIYYLEDLVSNKWAEVSTYSNLSSLASSLVYTTGNQTISGSKTFAASRYVFSGANVIFTNNTGIVSGEWRFANRPTVNGTGVLLSGEADLSSTVRTTGDQTISGSKIFSTGNGAFLKGELIFTNNAFVPRSVGNGNIATTTFLNSSSPFESSTWNLSTTGIKWFLDFSLSTPETLSRHIRTQALTTKSGSSTDLSLNTMKIDQSFMLNTTGVIRPYYPNISPPSIFFQANFSNLSLEERLQKIESSGAFAILPSEKMGVGTYQASEKLHVVGNVKVDGGLILNQRPTVNGTGVLLQGEGGGVSSIINTTYSTLTGLKAVTGLTPGQLYRISDFHLTWYNQSINDTGVKSGLAPEPLIVLALSGNKISHEAKSELYPQDTVYYDIDATSSNSWGTINNNTPIPDFKGWIYRRIDHKLNIDIAWDWRHITVNCCRPIVTGVPIWTGTTNYNQFSIVRGNTIQTTGKLYYSNINSNSGNIFTNEYIWIPVSDFVEGNTYFSTDESFGFRAYNKTGIFVNLPPNTGTRIQQPTFTSSLTGQGTFSLINCNNIKIEGGYSNVILGNSFYSNIIGSDFYSNAIGRDFRNNTIGNSFYSNTIGDSFSSNKIGNFFTTNTLESNFNSNHIGNSFYSNTIAPFFTNNTVTNNFYSNTIATSFYSNTIGSYFRTNIIGPYFQANTIETFFRTNTIGIDFQTNTIGSFFRDNIIGSSFITNTIGSSFETNTIGSSFNSNTIGNNFRRNTSEDNLSIGNVTGATHVYNSYNTRLFINSNLTVRLSYFNSSDQLVVTDPTA